MKYRSTITALLVSPLFACICTTASAVSVTDADIHSNQYLFQTTFSGTTGTGVRPYTESYARLSYVASSSEGWIQLAANQTQGEFVLKFDFSQSQYRPDSFTYESALGFNSANPANVASVKNYYSTDGVNWIHIVQGDQTISSWANPPRLNTGTVVLTEGIVTDTIYYKAVITQSESGTGIRWGFEGTSVNSPVNASLLEKGHGFAIGFNVTPIPEPSYAGIAVGVVAAALAVLRFRKSRR